MAVFCAYEATFISIKQPKQEPRSKSAGANVPRQPCPDRSYVESLEERASALAFLESERSEQSEGSAGHPELCFKPCLYLAYGSGACPRRSSCSFCHLPHPKRAASCSGSWARRIFWHWYSHTCVPRRSQAQTAYWASWRLTWHLSPPPMR
ncbi:unnamed protein product [Effrenium voratum]|uniref:C3H1-type domain-containing protein n=1 Tax=Effrenium voratum TaxID=2562239 RepID=A0AA36HL61_9DINO|nr:unnamed protein product [Effrenium voratum]